MRHTYIRCVAQRQEPQGWGWGSQSERSRNNEGAEEPGQERAKAAGGPTPAEVQGGDQSPERLQLQNFLILLSNHVLS